MPAGFSEYKCIQKPELKSTYDIFTSTVYLLSPEYFFQFFACLLIIFGAEVAAGVFGFLNKDKVHLLF